MMLQMLFRSCLPRLQRLRVFLVLLIGPYGVIDKAVSLSVVQLSPGVYCLRGNDVCITRRHCYKIQTKSVELHVCSKKIIKLFLWTQLKQVFNNKLTALYIIRTTNFA